MEQKQRHINAQMQHIDERLRAVHANSSSIEQQIHEILARVREKLKSETQVRALWGAKTQAHGRWGGLRRSPPAAKPPFVSHQLPALDLLLVVCSPH